MTAPAPRASEARTASAATALLPIKTAPSTGSALVAVVSINNQSITVWDQSGPVLHSKVSTGQPGHATPTGLFSVIQKNRFHESNIYSGAPMPWMHRITWSGIALHAGVVPNHPASHGCIRLPYDVAPKLWAISRMGMRVVVAPSEARPAMVDDALLPQPQILSHMELAALLRGADGSGLSDGILPAADTGRTFNPVEVAGLLRKQATSALEAGKLKARELLAVSAQASAEANAAVDELREARAELETAAADAQSQARTADADTKDQVDRAAAKIAADRRLATAQHRVARAVADEADKNPRAFAAARAAREAEIAADDAPELARDSARRVEPISIFVSRKEGHLFIRQGFEPVLDAAVEIDDAIEPLGTHVFTAMAPAADGKTLRWSALTMPGTEGSISATAALARIKMPERVNQEIARRVWTGASLIISDQGISNETGKGTDFVILTK